MKWVMLAWTGVVGYVTLRGLLELPPPEPGWESAWMIGLFIGLMVQFGIWLCGALPIYLIWRMFSRSGDAVPSGDMSPSGRRVLPASAFARSDPPAPAVPDGAEVRP